MCFMVQTLVEEHPVRGPLPDQRCRAWSWHEDLEALGRLPSVCTPPNEQHPEAFNRIQ